MNDQQGQEIANTLVRIDIKLKSLNDVLIEMMKHLAAIASAADKATK